MQLLECTSKVVKENESVTTEKLNIERPYAEYEKVSNWSIWCIQLYKFSITQGFNDDEGGRRL